jgi:hypothetical protein
LTLVNVVLDLTNNLLSVIALAAKGVIVEFENDIVGCYKDKWLIITGKIRSNLFNSLLTAVKNCNMVIEDDIYLWHKRLGHALAEKVKQRFVKQGKSIKVIPGVISCADCLKANVKKKASLKDTRLYGKLETVKDDLCGPFQITSIGKSRYFFCLIKFFSGFVKIGFFETKDARTITETLLFWLDRLMIETKERIKNFRSDSGGEFLSQQLIEGLRS